MNIAIRKKKFFQVKAKPVVRQGRKTTGLNDSRVAIG
jgi:hypothetical protein